VCTKSLSFFLSGDFPDSDDVVGVSGKEGGTIGAPCEGEGSWVSALGLEVWAVVLVEIGDQALALQIPDLDARLGGGTEPIPGGTEAQAVDDVSSIEGIEVLALIQIPQPGGTVLSTGSTERTIGRNGHGVDVASVANQIGSELAVGEVPHLDQLVPTGRDDDGVFECLAKTSHS